MNAKHTPGPWHRGMGNGEGSIFTDVEGQRMSYERGGTVLYPICTIVRSFDRVQDEANARLIAAAPELVAALENLLAEVKSSAEGLDCTSPLAREHAAQALAKARGE